MSDNVNALAAGASVGQFRILKVLGAGGFGITYLGEDIHLARKVALKEYFPEQFARRVGSQVVARDAAAKQIFEWGLDRFSHEAQILAAFQHPNIGWVQQFIPDLNGTAYIAMEYLQGETLQDQMAAAGLLPIERILAIFDMLLDGCEAIHREGIRHRDINPSNVMMIAPRDQKAKGDGGAQRYTFPVLIDFGAARRTAAPGEGHSAIVTVGYSPPEQYSRTASQNDATDIYALAATIYYLLSGQAPPDSAARLMDPLPPIAPDREAQLPKGFLAGLLKGLEYENARRPQTVAAWRQVLGPLSRPAGPPPQPARRLERRHVLIGGAVTGALVLTGGAAAFLVAPRTIRGGAKPLKVAWKKTFGLMKADPLGQVVATESGALIAAHRLGADENYRMLALRVSDSGDALSEWMDDGPGGRAHAVLAAPDGGAFIGGTVADTAVLVRLGSDWKPQWRREVGVGAVKSIAARENGVVVGLEEPTSAKAPLVALDANGSLVWKADVDKADGEGIERMIRLAKGGYAVLGSGTRGRDTAQGRQVDSYAWVGLLDDEGKLRNRPQTNGLGMALGLSIVESNGTLYVAGRTSDGRPESPPKLLLWAIDATGVDRWQHWDYPDTPTVGRALALSSDGVLYLAGRSGAPSEMFLGQVGPNGEVVWNAKSPAGGPNSGAFGLAMRKAGDGFAAAVAEVSGDIGQLVLARLKA